MRVDSRDRFSATVDLYKKYRPSYPPALIDWLLEVGQLAPRDRVADLGCGTGISTRLLAARGLEVVGIDPNEDMLASARAEGGVATYQRGEAAATGLANASVKMATAAQAFHWFDIPKTQAELKRILVPGGRAAAFWNIRTDSPFNDDYERLLQTFSKEYPELSHVDTVERIQASPATIDAVEAGFRNAQTLDHEGFRGRVYSSSYVVHGVDRKEDFDRELEAIFARHAVGGRLEVVYDVQAIAWRVR